MQSCPVSWDCRIHRLLLCRRVWLPWRVSWIWHKTIWWWGSSNPGGLENAEYPFIVIAPKFTLACSGSTWLGPIELNSLLTLRWIAWNRAVLTFKLCTYAKLNTWNRTVLTFKLHIYARMNYLKWKCFCMVNWIIWNRTVLTFNRV